MESLLEHKVVLVTGGGSGIGKASCIRFAQEGAKVVVADINVDQGKAVAAEIVATGGEAVFVKADVSNIKAVEEMIKEAVEAFGRLDCAFNNAGIGGSVAAMSADYPVEDWQKVIDINLTGVWLCQKAELTQMLKQGGCGAILNMSSILGKVGFATATAYVAAKHGVIGITQVAALEYSKDNIRVNAICPAFIRTPLLDNAGITENSDFEGVLIKDHPICRLGRAEEVAAQAAWLLSDQASFTTGTAVEIDGAYLAR